MKLYAQCGSDAFNGYLNCELQSLASTTQQVLGSNFVALLLGGGYGRGEGGVWKQGNRERPYNDLDLTLIVQNSNAIPNGSLAQVKQEYEKRLGIHVDFSRPLTPEQIASLPHTMMWHDLAKGHQVLAGSPSIFNENVPCNLFDPLPSIEATRLLLNRGAGLLWAMLIANDVEPAPDEDFVRRNAYKCLLALGDAILIVHKEYEPSNPWRDIRLQELLEKANTLPTEIIVSGYRSALKFKALPNSLPNLQHSVEELDGIAQLWGAVLLYCESKRTGRVWSSIQEYADWRGVREAAQNRIKDLPRNFVRNLQNGCISLLYPRESLYRELPILLGLGKKKAQLSTICPFLETWRKCN